MFFHKKGGICRIVLYGETEGVILLFYPEGLARGGRVDPWESLTAMYNFNFFVS